MKLYLLLLHFLLIIFLEIISKVVIPSENKLFVFISFITHPLHIRYDSCLALRKAYLTHLSLGDVPTEYGIPYTQPGLKFVSVAHVLNKVVQTTTIICKFNSLVFNFTCCVKQYAFTSLNPPLEEFCRTN